MPADIVTMADCASNYGVYEVTGSKGARYTVTLTGSEGMPHCTCKGFSFRHDCKHVAAVYEGACLYNPQWHDAKEHPTHRPVEYTYTQFAEGERCTCGGPLVYVKRAV